MPSQDAGDMNPALMQKFDVFLSHKRTDAKDFARALYNLLVLRGIKTFLDFGEYALRQGFFNIQSIHAQKQRSGLRGSGERKGCGSSGL